MADEPTGNLDSETSKQVFNVLKKLAKNKLIVVVSHDEEAANTYADRIIRISDGMVVSDSKEYTSATRKELKLVNAKLPFMYSFKMGLGNLLHKKLKLVFSVLLIVLCLTCFGLMVSVSNIDINEDYIRLFEENGPVEVSVKKYKEKVDWQKILVEEFTPPFKTDGLVPETLDETFVNEKILNNEKIRSQIINDYLKGAFKIVVDAENDLILGATLYSQGAEELINMIKVAMDNNIPYTYFKNQIFTHPTMAENLNDLCNF